MRLHITALRAAGFRNLANVELADLPAAVALFGMNRQGKSSILYAWQMLAFGWCPLTGRNGQGAAALIKDGETAACVEADVTVSDAATGDRQYTLSLDLRRKGSGSAQEFAAVDVASGQTAARNREDFYKLIGLDATTAAACAMPALFLESGEASEIMASTLIRTLDPDELAGWLGEHREWVTAFASRKRCSLATPQDLPILGEAAYKERTEFNTRLKDARARQADLGAAELPVDGKGRTRTVEEIDTLRTGVATARVTLAGLQRELGAAQAARPAAEVAEERDGLTADLTQADADATLAQAQYDAAVTEAEQAQTALDLARKAESNNLEAARVARVKLADTDAALAAVEDKSGCCPTCRQKLTAATRKALLGPLETQRAALLEEAAQGDDEAERIRRNELPPLREALAAYQASMRDAQNQRTACAAVVAKLQARIQALPAASDTRPVADIEADIADAEAKIARGEAIVRALEHARDVQENDAHLAAVEAELEHLNWAVKAFRDGDLVKPLLRGGLDAFAERCNRELQAFGYALTVDVDGKRVSVLLEAPGREARPVALCSGAERALAAVSVALAFADWGAPVLMDNVNDLDYEVRRELLRRLRAHADGSWWVAGASQNKADLAKLAAGIAPAALVDVVDGEALVVPAAAAEDSRSEVAA
jgi:hypothetical protein